MKKYFDIKSFIIFILITGIGGALLSNFTELGFFGSSLIVGSAILINGIVIELLDD